MAKDNKDNPSNTSNQPNTSKPTDSSKKSSSVSAIELPKLGDSVEYTPPPDLDGIDYSTIEYPNKEQLEKELKAINAIIGCKLKEVRLSARFTEQELAIILGVSVRRIRQYEAGKASLSIAELMVLCKELGADAWYFVMNGW
jgi:DNA-binding transcriptional regulator YiaG